MEKIQGTITESMALLLLKILRQVYNENEQVEQKKKCSEEKTLGSLMGQKERFVWKQLQG